MRSNVQITQKHIDANLIAEAVLVGGVPMFLFREAGRKPVLKPSVELPGRTLKPMLEQGYLAKPYIFENEEEIQSYVERARKETIDSLYNKVRHVLRKKYLVTPREHTSLVAADIIFTYFQDRIGLTHYLFFVGHPGSGKTTYLHLINNLAYRNFMSTDITPANIYQLLGSGQEGQVTICEDEADSIATNPVKLKLLKQGYSTGSRILRIDTSNGRKQMSYNDFGFKAFAAERLPYGNTAMGFNERLIVIKCTIGNPAYDIQEVLNPAGNPKLEALQAELVDIRKLLFMYRILHFNDMIPNIDLNISNREKQLFKPILRLFYGSKSFQELCIVASKYLTERRRASNDSWYAFLLYIVTSLIETKHTLEIPIKLIWSTIVSELPDGERIGEMIYLSEQFGRLSQQKTTETLIDVFGAKRASRHGQQRKLIFRRTVLEKIALRYRQDEEIKVQVRMGTNGTDGTSRASGRNKKIEIRKKRG